MSLIVYILQWILWFPMYLILTPILIVLRFLRLVIDFVMEVVVMGWNTRPKWKDDA